MQIFLTIIASLLVISWLTLLFSATKKERYKATFKNLLSLPGVVLLRRVDGIGKGSIHKEILSMCLELYGKKNAAVRAELLLAKMLSFSILLTALVLTLAVVVIAAISLTIGVAVACFGTLLVITLIYSAYDDLRDRVKKRRASICRQFPNVVSKLALLVTSGMIMSRAWKQTAISQKSYLYLEMQRTSEELENLVSHEVAYSNFISRCNTKETAKLATAIMQNHSKGNAEIGKLLKDMAREAWHERRHTAKREAEKANSKLMIPTMLLFLAILIMLMVPIALNFSGI